MAKHHDRANAPPPVSPDPAPSQPTFVRLQRRFLLREHARYLAALLDRDTGSPRAALEAELWRIHRTLLRS